MAGIYDHKGNPVGFNGNNPRESLENLSAQDREDRRHVQGSRYYYDGANQETADNPEHWKHADTLSAKAANSLAVRKMLRNRVRFEVANNCYGEGIVQTDADYIMGTGPTVQFRVPAGSPDRMKNEARRAEMLFRKWSRHESINFPKMLRTAWRCRLQDGEPFIRLSNRSEPIYGINLKPELIECDRVTDPTAEVAFNDKNVVDGVVVRDGEPQEYLVLENHPGDMTGYGWKEYDTVDADDMIHWFKPTRPHQYRGVPELAPALPLFSHLRRLTIATIKSAENAADLSLLLKTTMLPDGDGAYPVQPLSTFPMEAGMMMAMPEGWEPFQMQGEQPTQEYPDFKHEIVGEFGRCISMPLILALGDTRESSYASGRMDLKQYWHRVSNRQDDCQIEVVNPIVREWWKEARQAHNIMLEWDQLEVECFWDRQRHVDPDKESKANDRDLRNGSVSIDELYAERGMDADRELERMAETLGITVEGLRYNIGSNLFEGWQTSPGDSDNNAQATMRDRLGEKILMGPYPNEHAARLRDPDQYEEFRRAENEFDDGIHAIYGIKDDAAELQSIRFDADMWSADEARTWLTEHDYDPIEFEEATGD